MYALIHQKRCKNGRIFTYKHSCIHYTIEMAKMQANSAYNSPLSFMQIIPILEACFVTFSNGFQLYDPLLQKSVEIGLLQKKCYPLATKKSL